MSSTIRKSERYDRPPSDAEALPAFQVVLKQRAAQPKTQEKSLRPVRKEAPPPDGIDHTELLTLQNLGDLPPSLALTPLYFNALQRHLGAMFTSDMVGHRLDLGPYRFSGLNGRINGVEYIDETGADYGIVRDPERRLHLTIGNRITPLSAASPTQQERAIAMLRQAAITAYVSVGFAHQPRFTE